MNRTSVITKVILAAAMMAVPAVADTGALPIPQNSKLVGDVSVTEIRQFPEETQGKGAKQGAEETQGIQGDDRLYETNGSYAATVTFLDHTLQDQHFVVDYKTTARTSTVWALARPDGSPARLAVRNTNPTTVEWVTVRSASGSEQ